MTYAYWKNGKTEDSAVFDLFFRKNPFQGEYCIFAGLDESLKFMSSFRLPAVSLFSYFNIINVIIRTDSQQTMWSI
jgi:nicotinic acid phosphoribosyltransferase